MDAAGLLKISITEKYETVTYGNPVTISGLERGFYILTVDYDYANLTSIFILGPEGIASTIRHSLKDQVEISFSNGIITFTNVNYGTYVIKCRLTKI